MGTIVLFAALPFVSPPALGEDFYKGKTFIIFVSVDAGTSYDLYARTIGRHIARHFRRTDSCSSGACPVQEGSRRQTFYLPPRHKTGSR